MTYNRQKVYKAWMVPTADLPDKIPAFLAINLSARKWCSADRQCRITVEWYEPEKKEK